jgi:peptidoglycan/LPS O-acetylase OafA/YrhL
MICFAILPSITDTDKSPDPRPLEPRKHFLATFDGWRAIGALMVVLAHSFGFEGYWSERLRKCINDFDFGGFGVNVFFALSGFLITYLMLVEKDSTGVFRLSNFWIRRICRIVPLTWFYIVVVGLLTIAGLEEMRLNDLPPAFLFYYNYFFVLSNGVEWPLRHYWTLGVEMQFYFFWSVAVWITGCRNVVLLSLACALLIGVWRWYMGHLGYEIDELRTDFKADSLFMGAFFGSLYFSAKGKSLLTKCLRPWSVLVILWGLIFIVGYRPHGDLVVEPILFGALITGTLLNASHRAFHWLEWAPLTFVGRISFSVYVWQQLFTGFGLFHARTMPAILPTLCGLFVVSWLSYRYIEVPAMRLGARLIARNKSSPRPLIPAPVESLNKVAGPP